MTTLPGQNDPVSHDPAAIVARLEASARRHESPCGQGTMVWRAWGNGPPLVLFHGAQGSWAHWIRNVETLSASRTVWVMDLPGCGDSAMPEAETHDALSAVLCAGMAGLPGLADGTDMAGFSMGGVIAANLAARYPHCVRQLVLIGTGGLDTPHGVIDLGRVRGLEGDARRARLRANLLGLMLHHPDSADDLAVFLLERDGTRGKLGGMNLVVPDRLLAILPDVAAQVDVIWGEFDRPHPDPHLQASVIRRSHPGARLRVIPGAGHWAMYERADAVNAALLELLG